jgi:hypothetical protein
LEWTHSFTVPLFDRDDAKSNTTVHVSNLPPDITSEALATQFSNVGPIRAAFVVTDKETSASHSSEAKRLSLTLFLGSGASRGFGYVKFVLLADAETAIKTPPSTLPGARCTWAKRRLRDDEAAAHVPKPRPKWAEKKEEKRKQRVDEPADKEKDKVAARTVLVHGLPTEEDEEETDWKQLLRTKVKKIASAFSSATGGKSEENVEVKVDWPVLIEGEAYGTPHVTCASLTYADHTAKQRVSALQTQDWPPTSHINCTTMFSSRASSPRAPNSSATLSADEAVRVAVV